MKILILGLSEFLSINISSNCIDYENKYDNYDLIIWIFKLSITSTFRINAEIAIRVEKFDHYGFNTLSHCKIRKKK